MNAKYWDTCAFDWSSHYPFGDAKQQIFNFVKINIDKVISMLNAPCHILDIGAGANNREYFGFPSDVCCIDISHSMLYMQPRTKRIQADARAKLPIGDRSFDLITALFLIRYINSDQTKTLLLEMFRVLKPKGCLVVIDLPANQNPQQISKFDPLSFQKLAKKSGFKQVSGSMSTLTVNKYVSSGFGGSDYSADFQIGVVTAQKY